MTETVAHQALYRRWRAQTFAQIVGQEAAVETLRNAVRSGQVAHALLFVGPRGTGKTSLARIVAKALNCTDLRDGEPCDACPSCVAIREGTTLDLVEIDAASNRGIDDIRQLRDRLAYPPGELRRKVYILDEAHQLTRDAWNALLKSLEEPPDFVIFIFASTEPSGFPPAILSRLQRFDIRRLTVPEIEGKLRRILAADGRTADDDAIALIAHLAAGGMRDAESMLDQLLAWGDERLDGNRVRSLLGLAEADVVDALTDALVRGDAVAGIAILDDLEDRGRDLRALLDQLVEALRSAITARLAEPGGAPPLPALSAAATRLAAIDPTRSGPGGIRLQLELALLAPGGSTPSEAGAREASRAGAGAAASRAADATARETDPTTPGSSAAPARPTPAPAEDMTEQPMSAEQETAAEQPTPPEQETAAEQPTPEQETAAEQPTPEQETAAEQPSASEPSAAQEESSDAQEPPAAERPATSAAVRSEPPVPPRPSVPTAPSAAAPATAQGAPDDAATLAALRDQWPEIVAYVSRHPPTKPLIAACRPVAVDGATVTLGFPEGQAFLKDVAERRRANLEEGIGHFLGREVAVRCIATNIDPLTTLAGDDDGTRLLAEARRIFADDLVDVGDVG